MSIVTAELSEANIVAEAILSGFAGSPTTGFRRDNSRRKLFAMLDHAVAGPNLLAPKIGAQESRCARAIKFYRMMHRSNALRQNLLGQTSGLRG